MDLGRRRSMMTPRAQASSRRIPCSNSRISAGKSAPTLCGSVSGRKPSSDQLELFRAQQSVFRVARQRQLLTPLPHRRRRLRDVSPFLLADQTARGGIDSYRDGRLFAISSGWQGGFPFYAGAGNFAKGGSQGDEISVRQSNAALQFDATRTLTGVGQWSVGVGVDLQNARHQIRSLGVDSIANVPSAGAPDTATVPQRAVWSARSQTSGVFAQSELAMTRGITLKASLRNAWSSLVPDQSTSDYPSLSGSIGLLRAKSAAKNNSGPLSSAVVRGSWWRDANDVSPYSIQTMYAGRAPSGSVLPQGSGLCWPTRVLRRK